jgi:tetratricopeptide (TPR) repeat protein
MSSYKDVFGDRSIDEVICDISTLKSSPGLEELGSDYIAGSYQKILKGKDAQALFVDFLQRISLEDAKASRTWNFGDNDALTSAKVLIIGLASFDAFLQANVTGPPFPQASLLMNDVTSSGEMKLHRQKCILSLSVDGLAVYQYIPHVELFTFARSIFTEFFPQVVGGQTLDARWMRIRVNSYHQRLLSSGVNNIRLSDSVAILQNQIEGDMFALEQEMMGTNSAYPTDVKVQFLLEKAQIYIMQGLDVKARDNLGKAKKVSGFEYALSGALGKRTKFQQQSTSQLVVFAKSSAVGSSSKEETTAPTALELNDDTLLERIEFGKTDKDALSDLPPALADLQPDNQPQLKALDQIILLTEATLRDAAAPLDKLTSEEILPYAVRVLDDKPTNWQIYTQALLVRSRIESHRSRTQERSVLQLQAIVDQIVADTQEPSSLEPSRDAGNGVPQIQVTSFLPKPKESESAHITERLKYVFQLNTPTRWEIETELAYAWTKAGSLVSALEIFKRLRLWAEVALCYHSIHQEDRALQIIRRQLFYSKEGKEMDQYTVDAEKILTEKWDGDMREPPPPHAPRLWCILGDLEQDPSCWERAWEISGKHYARAQRTLGEYWTKQGDLAKARDAYMKATVVNRQNQESWSRLGDIDLKCGNWDGAIIAYQQALMIEDDDARTYSNLGSALLSKYSEMTKMGKLGKSAETHGVEEAELAEDEEEPAVSHERQVNPKDILRQALIAYKKGASLAYDNWQIWDNVITIAGRMNPPSFPEILMGIRAVIRIRAPTVGEASVDIDILHALVGEALAQEKDENPMTVENGIYTPPRGSLARAVIDMVDSEIVPLITARGELWALVEKLKLYRRDYAAALACAEKRWRIATAGEAWLEDQELWKVAADATENLVSAYENYGPQDRPDGSGEVERSWKMKARSAARGILGKARDVWEETAEYEALKETLEGLKNA